MGNIFDHIDDIEVLKELLTDCKSFEYGDDDLLDKQCGKSIIIEDTFEMIPYKVPDNRKTLIGVQTVEVVKWHLTATYVVPSHDHWEPDDTDEVELGDMLDFMDVIEKIQFAMHRWELDGAMEELYYRDLQIFEELNPEEAWPECMLEDK